MISESSFDGSMANAPPLAATIVAAPAAPVRRKLRRLIFFMINIFNTWLLSRIEEILWPEISLFRLIAGNIRIISDSRSNGNPYIK
jgi:hypothetical protein